MNDDKFKYRKKSQQTNKNAKKIMIVTSYSFKNKPYKLA
jgi:hypothetical protein